MPIPIPVTKTIIDTAAWGVPITNEVNRLTTATATTAWTNVTFQNGWSNYGSYVTQYRKIGDIVYLRGGVQGPGVGSVIFTLPTGFRPPADLQFAGPSYGVFGIFAIPPGGGVYVLAPTDVRFCGMNAIWAVS